MFETLFSWIFFDIAMDQIHNPLSLIKTIFQRKNWQERPAKFFTKIPKRHTDKKQKSNSFTCSIWWIKTIIFYMAKKETHLLLFSPSEIIICETPQGLAFQTCHLFPIKVFHMFVHMYIWNHKKCLSYRYGLEEATIIGR